MSAPDRDPYNPTEPEQWNTIEDRRRAFSMSEEVVDLFAALAKAQGAVANAAVDKENPHFKSRYATLAAVLEAVRKPLADNGLAVVQVVAGTDLVTMLTHSSGQWIRGVNPIPEHGGNLQRLGSSVTYLRRYSLAAITGCAPDDASEPEADDDGNRSAEASRGNQRETSASAELRRNSAGQPISEAQRKRLWAITCKRAEALADAGITGKAILSDVCKRLAIKSTTEIVRGYYETVVTAVEKWEPPEPAPAPEDVSQDPDGVDGDGGPF